MKKLIRLGLTLLGLTGFGAIGFSVVNAASPAAVNGCVYNATPPSLTDKQSTQIQCDSSGNLLTNADVVIDTSTLATSALQQTQIDNIGAPGATACATDTASCTLNAQLQRIAQRITTLISNLGGTNTIGAAPVTTVVVTGGNGSGATGGLTVADKKCDQHAKYDASDTGSITLVTGVSGRKVYICGYILATGGTATNLKLREGSDANCASNAADLTPAWQLVANDKIGALGSVPMGLQVSTAAYYVCVNASAANAHQAEIWYTIQ